MAPQRLEFYDDGTDYPSYVFTKHYEGVDVSVHKEGSYRILDMSMFSHHEAKTLRDWLNAHYPQ